MTDAWIEDVKFDSRGLVPVVAQDSESGRVLMLAWANREALLEAVKTRRGVYFSRSRNRLWRKGEESGNVQELLSVQLDCDGDSVIYEVRQLISPLAVIAPGNFHRIPGIPEVNEIRALHHASGSDVKAGDDPLS